MHESQRIKLIDACPFSLLLCSPGIIITTKSFGYNQKKVGRQIYCNSSVKPRGIILWVRPFMRGWYLIICAKFRRNKLKESSLTPFRMKINFKTGPLQIHKCMQVQSQGFIETVINTRETHGLSMVYSCRKLNFQFLIKQSILRPFDLWNTSV